MRKEKKCTRCGKVKSCEEFVKRKASRDGLTSHCKNCRKEYDMARRKKEDFKEKAKHYWNLYAYGLSESDYKAMITSQSGKCAICHESKKLVVDHDHNTKKVRGLICQQCNQAIGFLKDSPILARSAMQYLARGKAKGINWYLFPDLFVTLSEVGEHCDVLEL